VSPALWSDDVELNWSLQRERYQDLYGPECAGDGGRFMISARTCIRGDNEALLFATSSDYAFRGRRPEDDSATGGRRQRNESRRWMSKRCKRESSDRRQQEGMDGVMVISRERCEQAGRMHATTCESTKGSCFLIRHAPALAPFRHALTRSKRALLQRKAFFNWPSYFCRLHLLAQSCCIHGCCSRSKYLPTVCWGRSGSAHRPGKGTCISFHPIHLSYTKSNGRTGNHS